jgi:hypothetical protein
LPPFAHRVDYQQIKNFCGSIRTRFIWRSEKIVVDGHGTIGTEYGQFRSLAQGIVDSIARIKAWFSNSSMELVLAQNCNSR